MSEIVPYTEIKSTVEAFAGDFEPADLAEAKAAKKKQLESEFSHRVKIARIKWNADVVSPALKQLEKDWATGDFDVELFEVEEDNGAADYQAS